MRSSFQAGRRRARVLLTVVGIAGGLVAGTASGAEVREETILRDPYVAKVLGSRYRPGTLGKDGAQDLGKLKGAWDAIALGLSMRDERLVEEGVHGFESGFAQIGPDGSFGRSGLGGGGRFLLSFVGAWHLLRDSSLKDRYHSRLQAFVPKAEKATLFFLNAPQFAKEMQTIPEYTNQLLGLAVLFRGMGEIAGNSALTAKGTEHLESAVRAQRADGVLPEKGGYDSSYQAVSLQFLSFFYLYFPEHRAEALSRLKKGWAWELTRIPDDGNVMVSGNSRTGGQQEMAHGRYKDVNYREVALVLLYWAHIDGQPALRDKARTVMEFAIAKYGRRR